MIHKLYNVLKKRAAPGLLILLILALVGSTLSPLIRTAKAGSYSMQTGYYVGNGVASRAITGVGFQPEFIMIKSTTTAGVAVFKTSAMPANNTAYMSATADNTAGNIAFNADGFTIGTLANVNSANVLYTWTAFRGSDCTATGNFCVGTYTGNGVATRAITTGFQPSVVIAKRSTAVAAHFRTASMPANRTEFFTSTTADTAGGYIRSMDATSFTVGSTADNVNAGVYYYIAFKTDPGVAAEGTYTGDGTDSRNITGVGFQPDLLVIKNSTSATTNNRRAVMSTDQSNGDSASFIGDAVADLTNYVQALQSTGFQVGSGVGTNESTFTMYWFALGGAPPPHAAGGSSFTMATGSYTGNATARSIAGIGFQPDLVIIKDNAANQQVFRIKPMAGDITAYLAAATADFAGGITSIDSNGFSLGTSTVTNTTGNTYQWQAFGNAYESDSAGGASDFAVGTYYGNGIDNRDMVALPFQPDFVTIKRNSTSSASFRIAENSGDQSGFLASTAEAADNIQAFNATGFQVGSVVGVNASAGLMRWFAFKDGSNFGTGSYTGTGVDNRSVSTPGVSPDLIWIKRNTAIAGVARPSTLAGDSTQYFVNTANATGRIKTITGSGFTVGTQTEVNTLSGVYRYAYWRVPPSGTVGTDIVDGSGASVATPGYAMGSLNYAFECTESTGTLGTSTQKLRISNYSTNPAWSTSIAATGGATAVWANGGNTQQYDYNDPTGSPLGCTDGADADTKAGKLQIRPSTGTITPLAGCDTTGLSLGTDQNFDEGVTDSITLLSASSGAGIECYWDITGINLRQYVPADQPTDSYNLNFTITTVAS